MTDVIMLDADTNTGDLGKELKDTSAQLVTTSGQALTNETPKNANAFPTSPPYK